MKIQPLKDRVLVEAIDEDSEQIKGGIVIPDSAKEKPQEARVVALGTGGIDDDGNEIQFDTKVGDLVLTAKYGGTDVTMDDKEYKILKSSDILAIIKN
jgi:chaperonin GroES